MSCALRILVVDDEPFICQLIEDVLRMSSHTVVTASDGADALQKFGNGEFDVVITDKSMPGMDGRQLAAAIRKSRPAQPIILLTGYGDSEKVEGVDLVLAKPPSIGSLQRSVAEVMKVRQAA